MDTRVPQWRSIVVEELQLLASEAEQLAYERAVPHVNITAELISGWFDDTYHPDDSSFCTCFTEVELAALERFQKAFDEHLPLLPRSPASIRTWLDTKLWREVMLEAHSTLLKLAV